MSTNSEDSQAHAKTPILGLAMFRIDKYADRKMGIYIHCNDQLCQNGKVFKIEELILMLGCNATTQDIETRFTCQLCGRKPAGIKLLSLHTI